MARTIPNRARAKCDCGVAWDMPLFEGDIPKRLMDDLACHGALFPLHAAEFEIYEPKPRPWDYSDEA